MSKHVDELAKSLSALSRDDQIALVEKLAASLGPIDLHASARSPQSARLARLSAAMDFDSVGLKNATAELRRLGVPYDADNGVDVQKLSSAISAWSPEARIQNQERPRERRLAGLKIDRSNNRPLIWLSAAVSITHAIANSRAETLRRRRCAFFLVFGRKRAALIAGNEAARRHRGRAFHQGRNARPQPLSLSPFNLKLERETYYA